MAAKFKDKRTSITTVPNILRSFAIFATPPHFSLVPTFNVEWDIIPKTECRIILHVEISIAESPIIDLDWMDAEIPNAKLQIRLHPPLYMDIHHVLYSPNQTCPR
jgi:hypothetical protein